MSRRWHTFFSRRGTTQHPSSAARASENSITSNDGDNFEETGLQYLAALLENPVQLYTNAFTQLPECNGNAFRETFQKIKAIKWPKVVADEVKSLILDLIRANFKAQLAYLLTVKNEEFYETRFKCFNHIINTLPESFISDQGIFSDLFKKYSYSSYISKYAQECVSYLKDPDNSNATTLVPKFIALVTWGMPLVSIAEDLLTQILMLFTHKQLNSLIRITHVRPEDAGYINNIISSESILKLKLEEGSDDNGLVDTATLPNVAALTTAGMHSLPSSNHTPPTLTGSNSATESAELEAQGNIRNAWV